jgi:hypothetical protein
MGAAEDAGGDPKEGTMNRSWHCLAAAAMALLLAAAPAAAIGPADRDSQNVGRTSNGWLTVLAAWVGDLIGDGDRNSPRPASRPADEGAKPEGPPPQADGEPPADAETDDGPHWDPNG